MADEDVVDDGPYLQLELRLRAMADADAIRELVKDIRQTTQEERRLAQRALHVAMARDIEVFQVVLDAMCMEVIVPSKGERYRRSTLEVALEEGRKSIVMAVVERMRGYALDDVMACSQMFSLLDSGLFADEEVVETVVGVLPPSALGPGGSFDDCLIKALSLESKEDRKRAVDLVLRVGPSMEERLATRHRLRYVSKAAYHRDVELVKILHDLVPLLPDGSGRRAEDVDYRRVILRAADNAGDDYAAIRDYLVKQCGEGLFEDCDPSAVLQMETALGAEWLVTRAPHLLEGACQRVTDLVEFARSESAPVLMQHMVQSVDPASIAQLMRQRGLRSRFWNPTASDGWMWRLKVLHDGVPECMDGLRWPWLMEAIGYEAYKDVAYMVGMCKREHLVRRNHEGDTAYEVAERDEEFPKDLLARLKVATKGAHV